MNAAARPVQGSDRISPNIRYSSIVPSLSDFATLEEVFESWNTLAVPVIFCANGGRVLVRDLGDAKVRKEVIGLGSKVWKDGHKRRFTRLRAVATAIIDAYGVVAAAAVNVVHPVDGLNSLQRACAQLQSTVGFEGPTAKIPPPSAVGELLEKKRRIEKQKAT